MVEVSPLCLALFAFSFPNVFVRGNPTSRPFIPFRTSPYDQYHLHHELNWNDPVQGKSQVSTYDLASVHSDDTCPLEFSLGVGRRLHHAAPRQGGLGIVEPPVIFPIIPEAGPGRQVLYTTQYEHLDMLTPYQSSSTASGHENAPAREGLIQQMGFPLLFESSSFLTTPIVADVNGDGIVDVILADYDGGIYAMSLRKAPSSDSRWFHRAQAPRLWVRRQWMESLVNETLGINDKPKDTNEGEETITMADDVVVDPKSGREKPDDPYHSYFEYSYGVYNEHETILRGVPANPLGQDQDHIQGLEERRRRKVQHAPEIPTDSEPGGQFVDEPAEGDTEQDAAISSEATIDGDHRRLLDIVDARHTPSHRRLEEVNGANVEQEILQNENEHGRVDGDNLNPTQADGEASADTAGSSRDQRVEDDYLGYTGDDMYVGYSGGDDIIGGPNADSGEKSANHVPSYGDDDYPRYDDGYNRYDDYYGRYSSEKEDYYDDRHYVRIPPHILASPVLAELPKLYSQTGETESMLFLAVSYYFDEDEYEGFFSYKRYGDSDAGDETEVQRGMYVASAIMVYQFGDSPRWGRQEHLDISGDHTAPINSTLVGKIPLRADNTKMGAFALGSPTVADLNGDGSLDVIMGTSMGMVYALDARNLYSREGWPVQFQRGIESRILVEDVRGDTNLEVFVSDVGGTVACLSHIGEKLWHRNLMASVSGTEVIAASAMTLGDVNGDGTLDLALFLKIRIGDTVADYLFAMAADTGMDLANFPLRLGIPVPPTNDESEGLVVKKLPPPLLVDLHADQSWLKSYLHRGGTKFIKPEKLGSKGSYSHGGSNIGLHIVQPVGKNLVITEGASGCSRTVSLGEEIVAMVQADDVYGTNTVDLVVSTASGNVITLNTPVPFHPLNVWNNGEVRGRSNAFAHGYGASQGIFVHDVSREYRDIFGVFVPVTFEIFDNRPNIKNEPNRQVYVVQIRVGTSKPIFQKSYNSAGVYTERMHIPFGPGHYQLTAVLKSTHGIIYEDTFHLGYNVNYMEGFGMMLWLPLLVAAVFTYLFGTKHIHWDDEDYVGPDGNGQQGILGSPLPE